MTTFRFPIDDIKALHADEYSGRDFDIEVIAYADPSGGDDPRVPMKVLYRINFTDGTSVDKAVLILTTASPRTRRKSFATGWKTK